MKVDVVIIGGGHAGCEAAHAAAKMGCQTLMITLNPDRIGFMSCNPAMGGLAKGQLIREIDALGGIMGRNTDCTAIQYKRLNSSKGPAVRSSRAQCDKNRYAQSMQRMLAATPNLQILADEVLEISVATATVRGVKLRSAGFIECSSVIVTSGTFLQAIMHMGESQIPGGRHGDQNAQNLSASLKNLGFRLRRLKTGTPPRLHKDSIDWSKTDPQPGDRVPLPFSFYFRPAQFPVLPQVNCHVTFTNLRTHEIIEKNLSRSPMYSGAITGTGPRYCPSVEDKISRFKDKDRHQIFLEPEGLDVDEIYVNGVSTSLPKEVQESFIHTIDGLERARFIRHGYAVEYDAIDATQLKRTLESKEVAGLFLAGQVNGTSGYEEAGAQGLVAGINAANRTLSRAEFILGRQDAYIGVMIDDLVLKGSDEPYRMFTSRAEYRLLLREDNADERLSPLGHSLGLLDDTDFAVYLSKRDSIRDWSNRISESFLYPDTLTQAKFEKFGLGSIKDRVSAAVLLRRPEVHWETLVSLGLPFEGVDPIVSEQLEIGVKYEGYIKRDMELLETVRKSDEILIPQNLVFSTISGLSHEVRSRLERVRPENLGQMARIQGITPAAVANVLIHLKMLKRESSGRVEPV